MGDIPKENAGDGPLAPLPPSQANTDAQYFIEERRAASLDTAKQIQCTVFLGAVLVVAVPGMLLWSSGSSLDQAARTGLLLSALGMVIGIQTIVLGVWLLLLDVRSLSEIRLRAVLGATQPSKANVFAEHPGTIIVLAGVLLVAASLYRDWVIVEHGANPPAPSAKLKEAHNGGGTVSLPDGQTIAVPPFQK